MDNDNKIIIQKPEVRLFLQDDVATVFHEQASKYSIETEFENLRKNKKNNLILPLVILFLVAILVTMGVTHFIRYQNRQISVNVEVFEDLNLKKLLDVVAKIENQMKNLNTEKNRNEINRAAAIDKIVQIRDTEIEKINALPKNMVTQAEKEVAILAIYEQYGIQIDEINERFNGYQSEIDAQLSGLQDQLNSYDSANVERAMQQQAAIDSQRQVFELEKQELVENYEQTIKDLSETLTTMQDEAQTLRTTLIEEISSQYKAQTDKLEAEYTAVIQSLDPVISSEQKQEILDRAAKLSQAAIKEAQKAELANTETSAESENSLETLEGQQSTEYAESLEAQKTPINPLEAEQSSSVPSYEATAEDEAYSIENFSVEEALENAQIYRDSFNAAKEVVLSIPQEYDIPKYVIAMDTFNAELYKNYLATNEANAVKTEKLESDIKELNKNVNLLQDKNSSLQKQVSSFSKKAENLESENALLKTQKETLQKAYQYLDALSSEQGFSGFVLDTTNSAKMLVFVSALFAEDAKSASAYVFRKPDELIGTVTLNYADGFYYASASAETDPAQIQVGDKILIFYNN